MGWGGTATKKEGYWAGQLANFVRNRDAQTLKNLQDKDEAGVGCAWEWKEVREVGKGHEVVHFARRGRREDERRGK